MAKAEETPKLNLFQKLLKIQQEIKGLGKDGKSFGYQYVTGTKALEHIKPLMNELGLLLQPEVTGFYNERQDYNVKSGAKSEILTKVDMLFTWIDCDSGEKLPCKWGANGQNDWEKGFGSALTYGERYFLLKFFHIATDEDDIDNPDRETTPPVPPVVIDYKKTLTDSETLEQLKNAFIALPKEQKELLTDYKDEMKEILIQVEAIGKIKTLLALDAYILEFEKSTLKDNAKLKALIAKRQLELKG